jgi:hypothetical protein
VAAANAPSDGGTEAEAPPAEEVAS